MFKTGIDASNLTARFKNIEQRFRIETAMALNTSAFEVREAWGQKIKKVFDRPTPLTQRATLYKKATADHLVAEVYIRDEATKGTPPVRYLLPGVKGGARAQKASERQLSRNLGFKKYWVPGPGAPKDQYGNVPGSFIMRVLSSVQATNDPQQFTPGRKVSRRSRGKARTFFRPRAGIDSKLDRNTIYQRFDDGSIKPVLIGIDKPPQYRARFDAYGVAQRIFRARFHINMARAKQRLAKIRP